MDPYVIGLDGTRLAAQHLIRTLYCLVLLTQLTLFQGFAVTQPTKSNNIWPSHQAQISHLSPSSGVYNGMVI